MLTPGSYARAPLSGLFFLHFSSLALSFMVHSILLLVSSLLACVASAFVEQRAKNGVFDVLPMRKMGREQKLKVGGGGGEGRKPFSFPPHPRFIFCALPMFCAAKTRLLADLGGFLGFPFPKNTQERLLRRPSICVGSPRKERLLSRKTAGNPAYS